MSIPTIVDPTGVPASIDTIIPNAAQIIERTAELITTALKLLYSRIVESAGNIIRADVRSDPTKFIARTIMTAIITAMTKLYKRTFTPIAFEKSSSKVRAKILL